MELPTGDVTVKKSRTPGQLGFVDRSHRGAGRAPNKRRVDLNKPNTSPANQYCKNGGDHRFMERILLLMLRPNKKS